MAPRKKYSKVAAMENFMEKYTSNFKFRAMFPDNYDHTQRDKKTRISFNRISKVFGGLTKANLLGWGSYSWAWEIPDNKVVKITLRESDALLWTHVMGIDGYDDVLVPTYSVQSLGAGAYLILQEKLFQHDDEQLESLFNTIVDNPNKPLNELVNTKNEIVFGELIRRKVDKLGELSQEIYGNDTLLLDIKYANWGLLVKNDWSTLRILDIFGSELTF